jgi:putative flavoprotein involved in K+ transport
MQVMTARREVIVIGGGQAGLAIGYFPAEQGRRFTILEAAEEPAAAWRARWGLAQAVHTRPLRRPFRSAVPRRPSYPSRDEVASYLADYARHFDLPIELGSRARSISRNEGGYLVELDHRVYESDQVVAATGPGRNRSRSTSSAATCSGTWRPPD